MPVASSSRWIGIFLFVMIVNYFIVENRFTVQETQLTYVVIFIKKKQVTVNSGVSFHDKNSNNLYLDSLKIQDDATFLTSRNTKFPYK